MYDTAIVKFPKYEVLAYHYQDNMHDLSIEFTLHFQEMDFEIMIWNELETNIPIINKTIPTKWEIEENKYTYKNNKVNEKSIQIIFDRLNKTLYYEELSMF